MSRICTLVVTGTGVSMVLAALALIILMMMTFSPISVESLRTTMFLAIFVWGFGGIGLFVLGYGGLVLRRQSDEGEKEDDKL